MRNIILRDYQKKCVDIGVDYFEKEGKQKPSIIVAPTGSGKSLIISKIASNLEEPTLVIQPSKELLEQNYAKLLWFGGEASLYSASVGVKEIGHLTYATLGSIKNNVEEFKKLGVNNVIIDEAHTGYPPEKGSMFRKFIDKLNPDKVLGFTATPIRLKQYGDRYNSWSQLNMINRINPKFFKDILHIVPIQEMVEKGFWSNLMYEEYDFDESKLVLNSNKSEFTEFSIKRAISEQGINKNVFSRVQHLLDEGRKNILVFTDSVETAIKMHNYIPNISACVHGKTPKKERTQIIDDFKNGHIKVVFNYSALSVGFDHEQLDAVIIGRPTNSLAVYYQIVGRAVRIHPNKENSLIIDFCNNVKRFGNIENLEFKNLEGYGWGLFNKDRVLSGIPMGSEVYIKDLVRKIERKNNNTNEGEEYVMEFGEHKGKKLSEVPLAYRNWMLASIKGLYVKNINKEILKDQLLDLLEKEADIPNDPKRLIIIDLNNISYILHKSRKLSPDGIKAYKINISQKFGTSNIKVVTDWKKKEYWRKNIFPEYKDNRVKQDLDESFYEGLQSILQNTDVIKEKGLEADDIIAKEVRKDCYEYVIVVSSDSDFKQLAFFNKFKQFDPKNLNIIKTNKKEAIYTLVTKILKGDRKDNIGKCHNQRQIKTVDLEKCVDLIMNDIIKEVKKQSITDVSNIPLQAIFYIHLSSMFDIDIKKYNRNFKLINLIQDCQKINPQNNNLFNQN